MANTEKEVKKKSAIREWVDSIVFAVVAATLLKWLLLGNFTIPTGSMEKTLLINDYLFVSKLHYGVRTPETPLQVPLTHQLIPFLNTKSYSDLIKLPSFRWFKFSSVKNGDVVVFNYPGNPDNPNDTYGGYNMHPTDLRTYYIKRCIGTPSDVIEIRDTKVYVNGKPFAIPVKSEQMYLLETTTDINEKIFRKYDIRDFSQGSPTDKNTILYQINATQEDVAELKKQEFVKQISSLMVAKGDTSSPYYSETFPHNTRLFPWNKDNFGPLTVPKEGVTIQLDEKNIALYKNIITIYDGNKNANYANGKITIDGKEITSYTFKQDYYFMMGDNRDGSDDGRFWGFVPADHVLGKAMLIWMSMDEKGSFFDKVRWNRLFKIIE